MRSVSISLLSRALFHFDTHSICFKFSCSFFFNDLFSVIRFLLGFVCRGLACFFVLLHALGKESIDLVLQFGHLCLQGCQVRLLSGCDGNHMSKGLAGVRSGVGCSEIGHFGKIGTQGEV